jgi:hypothetical protein
MPIVDRFWALLAGIIVAFAVCASAVAAELGTPIGPVLVTIYGAIENTNRGPLDPFTDGVLAAQEAEFEEAAEFDLAMLEALGMRTVETGYKDWTASYVFEGPLLEDLMQAVGARGELVRIYGLDGYSGEIPMSDLEDYVVVFALKRDGRYLGIGGKGPGWIVYDTAANPEVNEQEESKWVWAAFRIEVE